MEEYNNQSGTGYQENNSPHQNSHSPNNEYATQQHLMYEAKNELDDLPPLSELEQRTEDEVAKVDTRIEKREYNILTPNSLTESLNLRPEQSGIQGISPITTEKQEVVYISRKDSASAEKEIERAILDLLKAA